MKEDVELANFIRTVALDGIGWAGMGTKGFPTNLRTIEELVSNFLRFFFFSMTLSP